MEEVQSLINEIKGVKTCTASKKDELRIMRAMMNDTSYKVATYDRNGQVGYICPSQEIRDMCASVLASTAKISNTEAEHLVREHEFKRSEAEHMIEFNKEYVNTYLQTGRKFPLGGREKSNISLSQKQIPAGYRTYPKCVGEDKSGNKIYAAGKTFVQGYDSVRVFAPAPAWLPEEKKK
jgi:hypothetical protein